MIARTMALLSRLSRDESGTALMEYSILLGMIVVATIGFVNYAGGWVSGRWSTLSTNLATSP